MTYRWIVYPNVVVLEDDDEPVQGALATITWSLPAGEARRRLRLGRQGHSVAQRSLLEA
jgi:hypothetical protein